MADLLAALVAILKADASTASIAGVNVFGGELPAEMTALMPRGALVVALSGGTSLTGGSYVEHDTQRVDLLSYGRTPHEAEALRDVAAMALRRVRRQVAAGVLVHWVKAAGGSANARDPDFAWPRAFQSFQVFHALNAVV